MKTPSSYRRGKTGQLPGQYDKFFKALCREKRPTDNVQYLRIPLSSRFPKSLRKSEENKLNIKVRRDKSYLNEI
jgi:hypothetical protein